MKRKGAAFVRPRGRPVKRCACTDDDFEQIALQRNLPRLQPGPTSVQEVALWPEDLLKLAIDKAGASGKEQVMVEFFRYGIGNTTDYSGFDGPREMMTQVYRDIRQRQASSFSIRDARFRFDRACDNFPLPLSVVLGRNGVRQFEIVRLQECHVMSDNCCSGSHCHLGSSSVPSVYDVEQGREAGGRRWVQQCPEVAFG